MSAVARPAQDGATSHVLPQERAKATFHVEDLRNLIGGSRRADNIANFTGHFQGSPFDDWHLDHFRSYQELYEKQIERAAAAVKVARSNPKFLKEHMQGHVAMREMYNSGALGIHFIAFLPFLETQANDEQKKKWLKGARSLEYIGAYAQTELGHGSNVRGLETTATFDPHTDEFVIHTPSLSALKWWPTGMYASTHAIVFAQLIIRGVKHGFHGFMVQLRDTEGCTLPGIEVGEIGPKLDGSNMNIGYARFTHVRVPRFNMFARTQQVTKSGEYIAAPPKLSKFKYIGMLQIRVGMVTGAYVMVARAATIATRYLCLRRQGFEDTKAEDPFTGGENAVLDYKLHQYRVLKAVSIAYMFSMSTRYVNDFLRRVRDGVMAGDEAAADGLPEMSATMSAMKALCTTIAHRECEAMRRACGGQGFLRASGLPDLLAMAAEPVTAEGEHVILTLQLSRFLIKSVQQVRAGGAVAGSMTYLQEPPLTQEVLGGPGAPALGVSAQSSDVAQLLVAMLRDRARRLAVKAEAGFAKERAAGAKFDAALNNVMVLSYKAAECHTKYILARNNYEVVSKQAEEGPVRAVLLRLFELCALQEIWEAAGDFMECLDAAAVDVVLERINHLLDALRPDAVPLVDGLGIPDSSLNSTLGRYDGNVYEAIYAAARQSPLNQSPRMIGWQSLAEIVDMDFLRQGMAEQRQGSPDPGSASKL